LAYQSQICKKKTSNGDFLDLGTFFVREYAVQFSAEDFLIVETYITRKSYERCM